MSPFFFLPDIRRLTFGFTKKKCYSNGDNNNKKVDLAWGLGRDDS
jgi:hypothetical protein